MMFRKQDKILIGAIAATAAVSALLMVSVRQDSGAAVRITIDGALYGEYSLSEEQSVLIDGELGHNTLVIEAGSAHMADADCPDRYCMDYKPISRGGETIVCLPHKLVVEVTGTQDAQQPDVVVP